jgi:hypothetical protein
MLHRDSCLEERKGGRKWNGKLFTDFSCSQS